MGCGAVWCESIIFNRGENPVKPQDRDKSIMYVHKGVGWSRVMKSRKTYNKNALKYWLSKKKKLDI